MRSLNRNTILRIIFGHRYRIIHSTIGAFTFVKSKRSSPGGECIVKESIKISVEETFVASRRFRFFNPLFFYDTYIRLSTVLTKEGREVTADLYDRTSSALQGGGGGRLLSECISS